MKPQSSKPKTFTQLVNAHSGQQKRKETIAKKKGK